MKKLLKIITGVTLSLAMAVGVGIGVASNNKKAEPVYATEVVFYTLDGTDSSQGNNGYATESDITQSGVSWKATANTTINPWRIGGKSINAVDRPIYSTNSLNTTITKVVLETGTSTLDSVNSTKLVVSSNSTFSNIIEEVSVPWTSNSTLTYQTQAAKSWTNAYYKFVFNVTKTANSNAYCQILSAAFYHDNGSGGQIDPTGIELNETNLNLFVGGHKQLTATLEPDGATGTVSWLSSASGIASVSNGNISAVAPGDATITAFIDEDADGQVDNSEISASCTVSVIQGSLADFNSAVKGDGVDFYAYYVGKYNNAAKGYFVSDGETGAYIHDPAPAGAQANDIYHIVGQVDVYNGLREIINTTATKVGLYAGLASPETLELDESALSSFVVADQGRKATITGRVTTISGEPNYNSNTLTYTITVGAKTINTILHKSWITENEYNDFVDKATQNAVVTIEAYVGAYKNSTTDLTQLTSSNYQLVNPRVTAIQAEELTDVALNKDELTLIVGGDETLTLSPVPGGAELGQVTWESSDNDVATVVDGTVTAIAEGNATITASAGGFSDTCSVTVINANNLTLEYDDMIAGGISTTAGAQTYIANGLKIEISNGIANGTNSDIRVYKNATITFTASSLYKIEFTCSGSNGVSNFANADGLNKSNSIWSGSSVSITFTVTGENQVRITELNVIYSPNVDFTVHTITFNSLNCGNFDSQNVLHGDTVNSLPQPVKAKDTVNQKKYEFGGWYYNVDPLNPNYAAGVLFTESTSVTSDLTLVAKYNEINYYIVSFESNGGTAIASVEVDEGDTVAAPADPVKASDGNYTYEFEGWYTNVGLTDPFSFSTPITDDLPLYAKYTAQLINSPRSFLNSASPIKTVHGRETPGLSQETTVSKTVLQMVGTPVPSNGTRRENLTVVSDAITLSVNADGNNGKVYSSGTEWRVYQGDNPQVVVAGQNGHLISSISFTFTVGNTGTFKYGNDAFESGDAIDFNNVSSATFTVGNSTGAANGQVKITAISVTYVAPTVTVDNVALRFGLSIPESDWESIRDHDGWTINDYGVMLMKEADLAGYTSIEDAFEKHASSSILKDIHQCQDETPYADPYFDGSDYVFTVKVSFPNDSQYYDDVIYANPYIVVNGTYYFLDDDLYTSVQDLADYYEGSSYEYLSDAALGILAGH